MKDEKAGMKVPTRFKDFIPYVDLSVTCEERPLPHPVLTGE